MILLPDDWSSSYYSLHNTNTNARFSSNIISDSQWNTLAQHGAVFLPAAGARNGTNVGNFGSYGFYWSATYSSSDRASQVYFYDYDLNAITNYYRRGGSSVRLVQNAE